MSNLTGTLRIIGDLHSVVGLMAEGRTPRETAFVLATERGMSRRNANRYVAAALAMLVRDHLAESLEGKRARILAMAQHGYETAMARERAHVVQAGKDTQAMVKVPDPDLKAAATFLAIIAKLEGH